MKTHDFKGYKFKHSVAKCADAYKRFLDSSDSKLSDVYASYSSAKVDAYESCDTMCDDLDGWDFAIVSHCQNFFTLGFLFPEPGTHLMCFAYITYANRYYARVNEIYDYLNKPRTEY